MRWIGIIYLCAAFVTLFGRAIEAKPICAESLEGQLGSDGPHTRDQLPKLTSKQCEALKSKDFRVPLLEIPQNKEDPMSLSLDGKENGATLRFKLPFSF